MTNRATNFEEFLFMPTEKVGSAKEKKSNLQKEEKIKNDYTVMQAAPITKLSLLFFFITVGMFLAFGWSVKEQKLFAADSGWGYYLGIIGSVMMLMLVLYPLRKKFANVKIFGPVKLWFNFHVILGTLGPACILFHANFGVGSLNSGVALVFTLLVAASGFFHMFIYSKIHYRLYGRKVTLQELQEQTEANRSSLQEIFEFAPKLKSRLLDFEEKVLASPHSVLESVIRILSIGIKTRLNYFIIMGGLRRGLKLVAQRDKWPKSEIKEQHTLNKELMKKHMRAILAIVEFSFYERLSGQWYLLHGPIFYMLIFVGLLHVAAVHIY